jgi:L-aminoadipate-semialdehyde dehydrogenase
LTFVSSTSVLDTEYYLNPSNIPRDGLSEGDLLPHSSTQLPNGYGQTKWVSEALIHDASQLGLNGTIIRPGYVTGHSKNGTSITDDFLVRILKGCIQLGAYPELGDDNLINCMPVDGVAAITVAGALHASTPVKVINAVSRTMGFNSYLFNLERLGFNVRYTKYEKWKVLLQKYVTSSVGDKTEEHALLPLLQLAVNDLPGDSRSPVLNTSNAKQLIEKENNEQVRFQVSDELVKRYIAYLVTVGFLPKPEEDEDLPVIEFDEKRREALSKLQGRGKV